MSVCLTVQYLTNTDMSKCTAYVGTYIIYVSTPMTVRMVV